MLSNVGALYFPRSSSDIWSSISVRKNELKIAHNTKQQKNEKGYGFLISAMNGDKHATVCAQKFTIPYADAINRVGKSLFTHMSVVLKIIDCPTREKQIMTGISSSFYDKKR